MAHMKLLSSVSVIATLVFSLSAGYVNAQDLTANQTQDQLKKVARYAIAIRGGASKGAYEAGLNWSLLKFLREISDSRTFIDEQTFRIELESITGASAGGINTLLSGLTWCSRLESEGGISNRIDNNIFRDIWLTGDISTLLPKDADSSDYLPDDAVLSRKALLQEAGKIRDLWNKPLFRKDCRIPLGLTVNRIEPDQLQVGDVNVKNQRFTIPFELQVMADNSIDYFFNPADYPRQADPAMILMPRAKNEAAFSISDQRILDILFTTSAYPMAFGRKRLQYCRLMVHKDVNPENQETGSMDKNLVCPDGYETSEAEFADGGLFDNLPIGLARILAERKSDATDNLYPVTYLYLDPSDVRYKIPQLDEGLACDGANPPESCRTMKYNLTSEGRLLLNAMGTARTYELYRELTSDSWQLNMSDIGYRLGETLQQRGSKLDCNDELPYFDRALDCTEALDRAGRLLEIAYDSTRPIIEPPYSVKQLLDTGVASRCSEKKLVTKSRLVTECVIDIPHYRMQLADAMQSIIKQAGLGSIKLVGDIEKSRLSLYNDRSLHVSTRGSPITGTLLGSFGSFLDYKFREYDYYAGVYDAAIMATSNQCSLNYSVTSQLESYRQCFDSLAKYFYDTSGIHSDPKGRYVFAMLAQDEYGDEELLRFAYQALPAEERDMRDIHDGLYVALQAGEKAQVFFEYLKANEFKATPERDGTASILEQIIDGPETWATEITRRATNRLVYLETEAERINAAQEPDPEKRKPAYTDLVGATSFVLQSATYKSPETTFSPSTAPDSWIWRNIIPFDMGLDLVEGDLIFGWQPTLALTKKDLLGVRASLGFTGGLFTSNKDKTRENFLGLGIGYTRKTPYWVVSSVGFTPIWYHSFVKPEIGERDSLGGEVHFNFLKDRLRVGMGVRDFDAPSDSVSLTLSVNDIPGVIYWLTR